MSQAYSTFNTQLLDLCRHMPVPKATYDQLWDHILRISARTFVEGYANAKKCSIEGRALMQLDFQQYLKNIEKLVNVKYVSYCTFTKFIACWTIALKQEEKFKKSTTLF